MSIVRLALLLAPPAMACGSASTGPFTARSGDTRLAVETRPFALRLRGDGAFASTAVGPGACGPLMLALRAPDDRSYHTPDDPRPDLRWLTSREATVTNERPLALRVKLAADDGTPGPAARVTVQAAADGFVDVDVIFEVDDAAVALAGACFELEEREHVVGGGERFDGVDLRGRTIPLFFQAPGSFASSTNESHVPVPFLATTRGLGLLVESERPGAFDVGESDRGRLRLLFHGNELRLRLRAGTVLENAAAHARRMGLPPMPPRWALAPMQWRNELAVSVDADGGIASTGRDRLLADARTLRELRIPTTTLWIDAPWQTGYNTFAFNPVQFPDPASMLRELERLGYRAIVWATEHLNVSDDSDQMVGMPPFGSLDLQRRFADAGWLVATADGTPFTFPWGRGNGTYVDFTNPTAAAAYGDLTRPILDLGIRGFKLDYGEAMRPDLLGLVPNDVPRFSDGTTTEVQHVRYARLYHEAFLRVLRERWPGDHFVITRTGGIHDQKSGVAIWPGDLDNDFTRSGEPERDGRPAVGGLPAAISAALSLSMSGYPLYGSDIGGYRGGPPDGEVLLRWAQFAALCTIMHLGGGGSGDATHNPWDPRYGPGAVDVYRRYARLHMDLLPTMEALVWRAVTEGTPVLVPLGVLAPDDEEAWADREAFAVGGDLLAAPVVEPATTRRVRFPPGAWLSWWNGEEHEGGTTAVVAAPLEEMPLYVRAGAVVALGDPRLQTAVSAEDPTVGDPDAYGDTMIVRTSAGPDGALILRDGTAIRQRTEGDTTRVEVLSPRARRVVVDLWTRAGLGPGDRAVLDAGTQPLQEVTSEVGLLDCATACAWRRAGRLGVAMRGERVAVTFAGR